MNNLSPNNSNLRDILRISLEDISNMNLIEYNNKHYILKEDLNNYMINTDTKNQNIVLESIYDFYNINSVDIIDESNDNKSNDESFICEFMILIESLDPDQVMSVAAGKQNTKMFMDQIAATILRRDYDKLSEINRYIRDCDIILEDIKEEKKNINSKSNSSYKFTAKFFFIIIKKLFRIFIYPKIISKTMKLPKPIENTMRKIDSSIDRMLKKAGDKAYSTIVNKPSSSRSSNINLSKAFAIGDTIGALSDIADDAKYLYLSIKDYEELLNIYETKINQIKSNLESQKKKLESKDK